MTILNNLPPAWLLFAAAVILPFLRGKARNILTVAAAAAAFMLIWHLDSDAARSVSFRGFELDLLRVDPTSKAFGYIFTLNAFAVFIYSWYVRGFVQHSSALLYMGSALGVVFAGDLITLYIYWEIMAVTSAVLIFAREEKRSYAAGMRYLLVHIVGGLILLAGILVLVNETGSIEFGHMTKMSAGPCLILAGFLVNAAAPLMGAWLPDAYPEATVTGGVILSAYTTKTAVYAMVRGFYGCDFLIWVGCAMAVYGIIYALLENDMRRILAYSIINQVGFMVCGIGIGTALAINGVVAHAFCHIIYKSLLWMSAGAVLYRTGKSKCTDLGGLYKSMPWTMALGTMGALAISAVPLTSGFTSKSMIISGAADEQLFWAWLVLQIASAGVFLHAGIKFPYFVFFAKDNGLRPPEAPISMRIGMGIMAALCLALGVFPGPLYAILPYTDSVYLPYSWGHVVTQIQLLIFSALVFFTPFFLKLLKRTDTIALDTDWFYRRGGRALTAALDHVLNGLNRRSDAAVFGRGVPAVVRWIHGFPGYLMGMVLGVLWTLSGVCKDERSQRRRRLAGAIDAGALPVGLSIMAGVVVFIALLSFL